MSEQLEWRIDHVAVAVPDAEVALGRWRDELGGGEVAKGDNGVFRWQQVRYANRGRLELLSPSPGTDDETTFVRAFLHRFGARVHHCTLTVDDLAGALEALRTEGVEPVDVQMESCTWQEMFLRPSVVGGMVVQVAMKGEGDDEDVLDTPDQAARPDAPELLGPRLRHPDLGYARWLWGLLGATVAADGDALRCRWERSRLDVVIEQGEPAGPVGLRMRGTAGLPAAADTGPAVESAGG